VIEDDKDYHPIDQKSEGGESVDDERDGKHREYLTSIIVADF
jgi:hypothetical protein